MKIFQLYVKHIPASFDTDSLRNLFSGYGNITEINYPIDKKTTLPKGYAFLTFETLEAAERALEKNNFEVEGQSLVVEMAKDKSVKPVIYNVYHRK